MTDSMVLLDINGAGTATIALNRPDVHNAFDDHLIRQLTDTEGQLGADAAVRCVVLTGMGASFSAGADLKWMQRMAQASEQQNREDSLRLAGLMRKLAFCPKTTIARVNGPAFGGGVGLVACCDIAISVDSASFGLTETRLGLVHQSVTADELDQAVAEETARVLDCGPRATGAAKSLVAAVGGRTENNQEQLDLATANLIASLRVSPEGQEGMTAFLEKRDPAWRSED